MHRTLPPLLLLSTLASLFLAPAAPAQVWPHSDWVGVYFEPAARTNWQALPVGVVDTVFVVVTEPTLGGIAIQGFDFRLGVPPTVQVVAVILPPGLVNQAVFPDFYVTQQTYVPRPDLCLLVGVAYRCLGPEPAFWEVSPTQSWGPQPALMMNYSLGGSLWYRMNANRQPSAVTNPDRRVVVDVTPDACDGRWQVDGPDGFLCAGHGDAVLPDLPFGDYTVTWQATGAWGAPPPATWTRLHNPWTGPCLFAGAFEPRARVVVAPEPAGVPAPWFLAGPDGAWLQGTGAGEVPGAAPGTWSLLWAPLAGWRQPDPNAQTRAVETGGTLTFTGRYGSPAAAPGRPDGVPAAARLHAAQPNPFNPRTTLRFELPAPASVRLEVFDLAGRLVRTLVTAAMPEGSHEAAWDGCDDGGRAVASGAYVARLTAGRETRTVGLQLVR